MGDVKYRFQVHFPLPLQRTQDAPGSVPREQRMKLSKILRLAFLCCVLLGEASVAADGPPVPPQQEDRTGAVDLRGLPTDVRSTRAKFEFLQHCSAYWRLKVHYERRRR